MLSAAVRFSQRGIQKVAVVGCGLMGSGIAQVAASAGHDVVCLEGNQEALDAGLKRIEGSLKLIAGRATKSKKNPITPEQAEKMVADTQGRLTGTLDRADLADADLVIEAIVEIMEPKKQLFSELNGICKPETIFASNTSSLSVTEMAEASGRPERTVGLHYFNPVPLMALVEVVQTDIADPEVVRASKAFVEKCKKVPIITKDTPGFVVNRLLVPYIGEAIEMMGKGIASKEDIDIGMRLACGYPMGPIHLADYVGLDTSLHVLEGWVENFPGERFFVPELLKEKVQEGKLGRKTGEGFYKWDGDTKIN